MPRPLSPRLFVPMVAVVAGLLAFSGSPGTLFAAGELLATATFTDGQGATIGAPKLLLAPNSTGTVEIRSETREYRLSIQASTSAPDAQHVIEARVIDRDKNGAATTLIAPKLITMTGKEAIVQTNNLKLTILVAPAPAR